MRFFAPAALRLGYSMAMPSPVIAADVLHHAARTLRLTYVNGETAVLSYHRHDWPRMQVPH